MQSQALQQAVWIYQAALWESGEGFGSHYQALTGDGEVEGCVLVLK